MKPCPVCGAESNIRCCEFGREPVLSFLQAHMLRVIEQRVTPLEAADYTAWFHATVYGLDSAPFVAAIQN